MPANSLQEIRKNLGRLSSKKRARALQRFFQTGPGQYGEGDVFLGVKVPDLRKLARRYRDDIGLSEAEQLLQSPLHEERFLALLFLIQAYQGASSQKMRRDIHLLYRRNLRFVNNWDLVDISAGHLVGAYLWEKEKGLLYRLARSEILWERRIAIIATSFFIQRENFNETLQIAEFLLNDQRDLIHKAVGWMLREVGKRDRQQLEGFLQGHHANMPRTMLRYSIERFPSALRQRYLKGIP